MTRLPSRTIRRALAVAAALATGGGTVAYLGSPAAATTPNRAPICNQISFNPPTTVGASVPIRVLDVAADPDVTQVKLVDAFGGYPSGAVAISNNGTPTIPGDDYLTFTRTNTSHGNIYLYWTVSDGLLSAQCTAFGYDQVFTEGG